MSGKRMFLEEQVGISPEPLKGWVIIYVRPDRDFPSMCSNIVDGDFARTMAAKMREEGHQVLAVCDANDLARFEQIPVADGIHPSHVMGGGPLSSCINCDAFPDTPRVRMPCTHSMRGKVEACCECGEDYPRSDLIAGHIYCEKCR